MMTASRSRVSRTRWTSWRFASPQSSRRSGCGHLASLSCLDCPLASSTGRWWVCRCCSTTSSWTSSPLPRMGKSRLGCATSRQSTTVRSSSETSRLADWIRLTGTRTFSCRCFSLSAPRRSSLSLSSNCYATQIASRSSKVPRTTHCGSPIRTGLGWSARRSPFSLRLAALLSAHRSASTARASLTAALLSARGGLGLSTRRSLPPYASRLSYPRTAVPPLRGRLTHRGSPIRDGLGSSARRSPAGSSARRSPAAHPSALSPRRARPQGFVGYWAYSGCRPLAALGAQAHRGALAPG